MQTTTNHKLIVRARSPYELEVTIPLGITVAETTLLHRVLRSAPEYRYDRRFDAYILPVTDANVTWIRQHLGDLEVDEYVPTVLENHAVELADRVAEPPPLELFKTQPYRHQLDALRSIHLRPFYALFMEMGTGKTKVMIDEACWQAHEHGRTTMLVVCPRSVIGQWLRELRKHAWVPYFAISEFRSDLAVDLKRFLRAERPLKVVVTNYEKLLNDMFREVLKLIRFKMLILDESTHIKNHRAKRTKAVWDLAETCERRFLLSGTPNPNGFHELWSQCRALRPGLLGVGSYERFLERYAITERRAGFTKIVGWRDLASLDKHLSRFSTVVTKKDCLDLPPKTYGDRTCELEQEHYKVYLQMATQLIAEIEEMDASVQASIILVKLLRLSQIVGGFLSTEDGRIVPIPKGNAKYELLAEVLDELQPKAVIWCRFVEEMKRCKQVVEEHGWSCELFYGATRQQDRERIIHAFNHGDLDVIVGNAATGGLGIDLLGTPDKPARTVIFFSNDFSYLKRAQAEDRCHRSGMHCPVTYIDLIARSTIDELIVERLLQKEEFIQWLQSSRESLATLLGV